MTAQLENPPNEDIITLGDAVHTFVQWPKRNITLDPVVPRSPHVHASPTEPSMTPPQPPLQKAIIPAPVETTPKKKEKYATSSPEKMYSKRDAKAKLKNIKTPRKAWTFELGMPFVPNILLPRLEVGCESLHA